MLESFVVPVELNLVQNFSQRIQIGLKLSAIPILQILQNLFLCLLNGIQLFLNIGQNRSHKQHRRVTGQHGHPCLSTANGSRRRFQRTDKFRAAAGCKHLLTHRVDKIDANHFKTLLRKRIAQKNNLKFLVDGAQGGGHIDLNIKDLNINMLALAGHKGLYGIMGSGALILDEKTDVEPLIYGGTGSESFNLNQPSCYPEKLEAGTLNLPAIAGLDEGVRFVGKNLKNFGEHLL